MKKIARTAPLLLALAILGCQNVAPVQTNSQFNQTSQTNQSQKVQYGYLTIRLALPQRVQGILSDMDTLKLSIKQNGTPIKLEGADSKSFTKDQFSSPVNLLIPVGDNYVLEAEASKSGQVIGFGYSGTFSITVNKRTTTSLKLAAPNTPVVISLDHQNGGEGITLTVTGRNFVAPAKAVFNTATATDSVDATVVDPTTITFVVPSQAINGPIEVISNGKTTSDNIPFKVIKAIDFVPPEKLTLLVTAAATALPIEAKDSTGAAIASPFITEWSSSNTAVGTFVNGIFTPVGVGTATVKARSGNTWSSERTVQVDPVPTPTPSNPNPLMVTFPATAIPGAVNGFVTVQVHDPVGGATIDLQIPAAALTGTTQTTLVVDAFVNTGTATTTVQLPVTIDKGTTTVTLTISSQDLQGKVYVQVNL